MAVHEIGHALGLDHNHNENSIMFPSYIPFPAGSMLPDYDRRSIQAIYGASDGNTGGNGGDNGGGNGGGNDGGEVEPSKPGKDGRTCISYLCQHISRKCRQTGGKYKFG